MSDSLSDLVACISNAGVLSQGQAVLLRLLADHFPKGLDEDALAKELHKDEGWTKLQSDVRTAISRLREELKKFFTYHRDGKKQRQCLQLPRGKPYRVEIGTNQHGLDPIERFWDHHFNNDGENLLMAAIQRV